MHNDQRSRQKEIGTQPWQRSITEVDKAPVLSGIMNKNGLSWNTNIFFATLRWGSEAEDFLSSL
jgi:hypothetical protein